MAPAFHGRGMRDMEACTSNRRPKHRVQVLLCTSSAGARFNGDGFDVVSSPVECLAKAIDIKPSIMLIHFAESAIREREALVELCDVLKHNSHTRATPLMALLHTRHRKLLESLRQAGVDYAGYLNTTPMDLSHLAGLIENLGPDDLLERQLERICPFLHYSPIDDEREIVVCGAYLDRLVLGRKCLHENCECETHLRCEYYLHPRLHS